MSNQLELPGTQGGEAPASKRSVEVRVAMHGNARSATSALMERVLSRPNLQFAMKLVIRNKGGPGIDGMTVEALPAYLRENWLRIREQLLAGFAE